MVQAGDSFFSTINNRLRPDQLQPGQVAYAQNMRMDVDGAAQPRKGVDAFGPVVEDNGDAVTLPFYLLIPRTINSAERVDDVVTIETDPLTGNWFSEGTATGEHRARQSATGISSTSRVASIYAKSGTNDRCRMVVVYNTTSIVEAIFDLSAKTITYIKNDGGLVAGGISEADNGWFRLWIAVSSGTSGGDELWFGAASGTSTSYTGTNRTLYFWGAQHESGALPSDPELTTGSVGTRNKLTYSADFKNAAWTKTNATLNDDPLVAIDGPSAPAIGMIVGIAGLTGSVNANGNQTVITAGTDIFTFEIPGATGSETYTLSSAQTQSPSLVVPAESFGSCLFSDPSNDNAEYIIIALRDKAVAVSLAAGTSSDIAYPAGVELTAPVNLLQVFGTVGILREGATALEWNGSFSGTPAFTKVANGTYTTNVYLNAASNTVIADGIVTVSETGHGLSVGTRIYVIDKGTSSLIEDNGGYVVATVPNANTFTFYAEVADMSAHAVVYSRKVSEGLGFSHMPAPGWASYHQRRLIVPYFYTTTGSSGSEVITDRNIRDELLISDILDGDTYDVLVNAFRVTAGTADYLQWVHPFTDDNAIAFNRNSIHLISGLSGSLTDISIKEITREAGLVAQKSVITIGSKIYFLSDNGLYAAEFGELYLLRGAGLPLSDPINPIIQRINSAHAHKAVAIYHDNRYWLAVPLDNSSVNNAILVFNVLNQGWESVDIIESDGWDISNFIRAGAGGVDKLYAVNRFGGIHILDAREDGNDRLYLYAGAAATISTPRAYVTTRQYNAGTSDRKKFNNFELHIESSESNVSDATISVETENQDSVAVLGNLSSYLGETLPVGEDASVSGRIGNIRGYGLQMTLTRTQGRPKLRMVKINAINGYNAQTSVS